MSDPKTEFDLLDFATKASKVIEQNFKLFLGLFIAAIIGGTVWTLINYQKKQTEMAAFTELYKITKIYNEKKTNFEEAKEEAEKAKDPKQEKPEEGEKKEKKNLVQATGDLEKDYAEVTQSLMQFIKNNSGSNASGEAALILSEIYDQYKKSDMGATALDDVMKNWGTKNVLYYVMQMRAGDLYASSNNCEKAISYWQVVANSKSFISKQAQLKLGVCLQEVGRMEEAKQWFTRLQEDDPNSSEGFSAKRYLRFLKFKSKVEDSTKADDKAQNNPAEKEKAS